MIRKTIFTVSLGVWGPAMRDGTVKLKFCGKRFLCLIPYLYISVKFYTLFLTKN